MHHGLQEVPSEDWLVELGMPGVYIEGIINGITPSLLEILPLVLLSVLRLEPQVPLPAEEQSLSPA
ncbi:hypothetical protein AABM17_2308 [Neisseria musculi]|uniref:Uncharacterized protein n=1 Tax=Neisseria musculi TaxID=1815583 RepID=A0A7H1MCH2_9NEIS|nr:hypothetical protein H7A79_2307 [Neisseria musculi]